MHVITTVKTSKSIVIPGQTRPWLGVEPEKFCPYSLTPSVPVATKLNVLRMAKRVRLSGTNLLTVSHPRASAWEYDLVRELD